MGSDDTSALFLLTGCWNPDKEPGKGKDRMNYWDNKRSGLEWWNCETG
jgi:hypothetical protein